nr:roadblock/LC7 domain-containing protein [Glycomyces mayteni]
MTRRTIMNTTSAQLDFLLNDFVGRVPHVTHVIAVAADGLLIASNNTLPRDEAERLSAIASGLTSLLAGAARSLQADPVISNLTEMNGGFMFSMSVSSGASILALAGLNCDIGQVGHELANLINQVGPALTPAARQVYAAQYQQQR